MLVVILRNYFIRFIHKTLQVHPPDEEEPWLDDRGGHSVRAARHHPHLHGPTDHRRHRKPQRKQTQERMRVNTTPNPPSQSSKRRKLNERKKIIKKPSDNTLGVVELRQEKFETSSTKEI